MLLNKDLKKAQSTPMNSPDQPQTHYDRKNPFMARLVERRRLTAPQSNKETQHAVVDFAGSGLLYEPGDSLGIYVQNDPDEVQALLRVTGLDGSSRVTLPREHNEYPLQEALLAHLDVGTPSTGFLRLMWQHVQDETERARLQELLEGPPPETQAFLAKHSYLSLLKDYPSVALDAQSLVSNLRRLQPRLYSIASSPTESPHRADLTISVVRYSIDGTQRSGVASTFLTERCPLNTPVLPVFVAPSHFRLPEDPSTPAIMIGPGTGIAAFRSFLKERAARGAPGPNWLFFGEQQQKYDFLYQEDLQALQAQGTLTHLSLAFSRDQPHKIYVQDRLRENAATVWDWIHNKKASLYVCGDAKHMAPDVQKALLDIIAQQGNLSPEAAEEFLKILKRDKRYQRDVY